MPEPHPVDFDWRFGAHTAKMLAEEALINGRVLCLGTPSVFAAISESGGSAHLIDRNPFLASRLLQNERCTVEICDIAVIQPSCEPFHAAVLDPPWYLSCYDLFISHAVSRLVRPSILLLTLFRELTRPGATGERARLLERLEKLGKVSILDREAIYATPRFEEEVLRRLQLPALPAWRAADIVRVEISEDGQWDVQPMGRDTGPVWRRFRIGDQVVAVMYRPADDVPINHEAPSAAPNGFSLYSVSNRDSDRARINIWTSRNRAAVARGTARLAALFAEKASEMHPPSPSLAPTLTESDYRAFDRLAVDLDISI